MNEIKGLLDDAEGTEQTKSESRQDHSKDLTFLMIILRIRVILRGRTGAELISQGGGVCGKRVQEEEELENDVVITRRLFSCASCITSWIYVLGNVVLLSFSHEKKLEP